jgi:hypothetical protein
MRARVFRQLIAVGALGALCLWSSACLVNDDTPPLSPLADPVPAAPPPATRTVPDADPGTNVGSDGGAEGDPVSGQGGGNPLALPTCTDSRTTRCCSYKNAVPGFPECTWILLTPAESAPITHALAEPFQIGKTPIPAEVPEGITLSVMRPDAIYSYEECMKAAASFRLAGHGLGEVSLVDAFSAMWAVYDNGTWVGLAGGTGQVLNWDTTLFPNNGPEPSAAGLGIACEHAKDHPETKYIAEVVYQINFAVDGTPYYDAASLRSLGEKDATGYLYMIEKKY